MNTGANGPLSPTSSAPLGLRRGVEKPRPLKTPPTSPSTAAPSSGSQASSVDEVMILMELVVANIRSGNYSKSVSSDIVRLNIALKNFGSLVEALHKDQLDRYMEEFALACKNAKIDLVSRLHLLEIIELRSLKWVPNDQVSNYYREKLSKLGMSDCNQDQSWPISAILNGTLPTTNQAGNARSSYSVSVGQDVITISGTNDNVLKIAKVVLDDYFGEHRLRGGESKENQIQDDIFRMLNVVREPLFPASKRETFASVENNSLMTDADRKAAERRANFAKTNAERGTVDDRRDALRYEREFLIHCALSTESQRPPADWKNILAEFPDLERKEMSNFCPKQLDAKPQRRLSTNNNQQLNLIKKHLTTASRPENVVSRIWDSEKNQWVLEQGAPSRA